MLNDFSFCNTTQVFFGHDQIGELAESIKKYGDKVMFVLGGGSIKEHGIYDEIMSVLDRSNIRIVEFSGVEPNPHNTTVNKGAELCRQTGVDVVLAVGGGSVIDCAKGIAIASKYVGDSWDLIRKKVLIHESLPLIAIPTTAATGSEMNCSCVISNLDSKQKFGFSHELIQPKVAFLNPKYTYSTSAFQTACGCVDIISHILDVAYFTRNEKMFMLNNMMEGVLKTVFKYAPIAIQKPCDYEARANLLWASSWALNGFLGRDRSIAPTCHYMEHELSAMYDIAHGWGIAVLIPKWMRYILNDDTAKDFQQLGINVLSIDKSLSTQEAAEKTIEYLEQFFYHTLKLEEKLSMLNIGVDDISAMANSVCFNGKLNGYQTLSIEDVKKIYTMCI